MKKLILLTTFIITTLCFSQNTVREEADEAFNSTLYTEAIYLYERLYYKDNTKDKGEIAYKIAEAHRFGNSYTQARKWYQESMYHKYTNPELDYNYGLTLLRDGDYKKATELFKKYQQANPSNTKVEQLIRNAEYGANNPYKDKKSVFKIANQRGVNTPNSDYSATVITSKEAIISSARSEKIDATTTQGFSDLYTAKYDSINHTLSLVTSLPKGLNSDYNDGNFVTSADGKKAYFTQCNGLDGKESKCDIMVADNINGIWKTPKKIGIANLKAHAGHPALTQDDKYMFFSSDADGTLGGKDIWYIQQLSESTWSTPVNVGNMLNTIGDEMFPAIQGDSILYFASDALLGYGGLDLYYSKITKTNSGGWEFSAPKNLGYPFNTSFDDFGISVIKGNKMKGFFASNRKDGSVGDDDIYSFEKMPEAILAKGIVKDEKTNLPITGAIVTLKLNGKEIDKLTTKDGKYEFANLKDGQNYEIIVEKPFYQGGNAAAKIPFSTDALGFEAEPTSLQKEYKNDVMIKPLSFLAIVKVVDKNTNAPLPNAKVYAKGTETQTTTTNPQGTCQLANEIKPDITYEVFAEVDGYFTDSRTLSTNAATISYNLEIPLLQITKEEIKLNNIYYDYNKATLRKESMIELDKLVDLLVKNPKVAIQLNSHSDARGNDAYNLKLSQSRAKSVVDYLISKGIEAQRLTPKGWGETDPEVIDAKTEDEHQKNRRTTFNVTNQ